MITKKKAEGENNEEIKEYTTFMLTKYKTLIQAEYTIKIGILSSCS